MNYKLLIATFIALMHHVEELMPDSPGKEKFDAVITMLEAVTGDLSAVTPTLLRTATTLVKAWKALGIFKSKTPTTQGA